MYPELFHIFHFPVHSYGFMLAVAFVVGTLLARMEARRREIPDECIVDLALWACIGAIIGARVFFVLLEWPYYSQNISAIFSLRDGGLGGLSFHGGVIGGVLAGLMVVRRYRQNPWRIADLVAPILALGTAITRVGCLLNGCCFGYVTDVPWALPCALGDPRDRHPTQLYAVAANLLLFLILWRRRCRVKYPGQLALHYVILYSIFRSVIEIWRESQILFGPFKTTQAASVLLILAALVVDRYLSNRNQLYENAGPKLSTEEIDGS